MIGVTVFATMAVLLIGYAITLYGGLLRTRQRVKRAWSTLEAALARRDRELTRLLELFRAQACANTKTLGCVERARTALESALKGGDVASIGDAEYALRAALHALYVTATERPKSNETVLVRTLQFRIRALGSAIRAQQRRYNEAARAQNARIELLPDAFIADLCHFTRVPLIEFGATTATSAIPLGVAFGK